MDLARPDVIDNRRREIAVDGLLLFYGAAIDTTVVSVLVSINTELDGRFWNPTRYTSAK